MEDIQMKDIENDEEIKAITNTKLTIQDFSIIKVIGKGSYGKVLLVKKNDEDHIYAMKVLKKKDMIKRKQVEHIKTERKIMELIDHPFVVKLRYAFQNSQKLYLVMDYCPGGELFFHIQRVNRFNEEVVKFYSAQMILALEHLHNNQIIYRDLKPENVLIDKGGYAKITDFGLAKENISDNSSANSFCGTPEYLAPEIIASKGHGQAVDWWSLGAIIYEMITGMPPFYAKDREKLFKMIKSGLVKYPHFLSEDAVSLLKGLFTIDPKSRLGSGLGGVNEIKQHPFFQTIDWLAIYQKQIKPPFIPKIQSDIDTKYIDREFTDCSPKDSLNAGDSLPNSQNPYKNFTYDSGDEIDKNGQNVEI